MSLEIYFKPIRSIEFSKNSIGSIVNSHVKSFPEWESSDIVFLQFMKIEEVPVRKRTK